MGLKLRNSHVNSHVKVVGRGGRFGRGASLFRYRSQLFGRLWVRLPLPTSKFSEI